ncbi:hypothetical protein Anapl_02295 [Anas platyrhynchos]|uniref:Uncharacterized protein n=1 Tax=Anas platyrhynchos TaxID=8839 RepID=R0KED3_ANAPL|nr:hypothetical protein Anapl_02295 [Anas platyrhynchos]
MKVAVSPRDPKSSPIKSCINSPFHAIFNTETMEEFFGWLVGWLFFSWPAQSFLIVTQPYGCSENTGQLLITDLHQCSSTDDDGCFRFTAVQHQDQMWTAVTLQCPADTKWVTLSKRKVKTKELNTIRIVPVEVLKPLIGNEHLRGSAFYVLSAKNQRKGADRTGRFPLRTCMLRQAGGLYKVGSWGEMNGKDSQDVRRAFQSAVDYFFTVLEDAEQNGNTCSEKGDCTNNRQCELFFQLNSWYNTMLRACIFIATSLSNDPSFKCFELDFYRSTLPLRFSALTVLPVFLQHIPIHPKRKGGLFLKVNRRREDVSPPRREHRKYSGVMHSTVTTVQKKKLDRHRVTKNHFKVKIFPVQWLRKQLKKNEIQLVGGDGVVEKANTSARQQWYALCAFPDVRNLPVGGLPVPARFKAH